MSKYEIAEVVLGSIGLLLTLAGLVLIVFGWIIPYKQNLKIEEKRQKAEENMQKSKWEVEQKMQKLKWEKELVDKQISQFYGPISALFEEQDYIRLRVFYMFGRNCIFDNEHPDFNSLTEREQKIWSHFIDTYKIPINNKIVDIIRNNRHLIYNSEIPDSYKLYLDYTLGWELLDNQKRNGVPNFYEYRYIYNFPIEFSDYIHKTLSLLLKRQSELAGKLELK